MATVGFVLIGITAFIALVLQGIYAGYQLFVWWVTVPSLKKFEEEHMAEEGYLYFQHFFKTGLKLGKPLCFIAGFLELTAYILIAVCYEIYWNLFILGFVVQVFNFVFTNYVMRPEIYFLLDFDPTKVGDEGDLQKYSRALHGYGSKHNLRLILQLTAFMGMLIQLIFLM